MLEEPITETASWTLFSRNDVISNIFGHYERLVNTRITLSNPGVTSPIGRGPRSNDSEGKEQRRGPLLLICEVTVCHDDAAPVEVSQSS